jgi:two-component system, chemotaxis family, CheB/CheR fusion protein
MSAWRSQIELLIMKIITNAERKFENTRLNTIAEDVKTELKETIEEKHATIEAPELCQVNISLFQFRQLMHNLISNALKF